MDERGENSSCQDVNVILKDLASYIHPGERGEFPLEGSVRDGILAELEFLVESGVLVFEGGIFVKFNSDGRNAILDRSVDLIDREKRLLYFKTRDDAVQFLNYLREVYPNRAFGFDSRDFSRSHR